MTAPVCIRSDSDIRTHRGKTCRVRASRWHCESGLRDYRDIVLTAGALLVPIGYLTENTYKFVWWLKKHVSSWSTQPAHTWAFLSAELKLTLFDDLPGSVLQAIRNTTPVFVIGCYPDMLVLHDDEEAPQPSQPPQSKRTIPEYPHRCPRCGSPSYNGFNVHVVCSKNCS